jgi:hypothetical protein
VSTTDQYGHFTAWPRQATYDVVVSEPDGSAISIFRGLSRKNLVLTHQSADDVTKNAATITGMASGGAAYPLSATDSLDIVFFSSQAQGAVTLGGGLPPESNGPHYGPLYVGWDGSGPVNGRLVALGRFASAAGSPLWFADQTVSIAPGQSVNANVALGPIANTRRIAARVVPAPGGSILLKGAFYRLAAPSAIIPLVKRLDPAPAFEEVVPESSPWGGELCLEAASTPGLAIVEVCAPDLNQAPVVLSPVAPPALQSPVAGTTLNAGSQISWTPFDSGIHMLALEAAQPSRRTPSVYLFQLASAIVWGDLQTLAVRLPAGASYRLRVVGFGPYASIDDACAGPGMTTTRPQHTVRSYSEPINVTTGL